MVADRRSPWVYVLLGCLGLLVLIGVVVGGLVFFGVRTARNVAADNEDPERRGDRALEIFGADEAPGPAAPRRGACRATRTSRH